MTLLLYSRTMNTIPEIRVVACIGTGQMGPGIAQTCAAAGYRAIVVGRSEEGLERARARIRANLAAMQPYGLADDEVVARIWANLEFVVGLAGSASADLVIEGVAEDLAVKQDVTEELDRLGAHVAAARALLADTAPVGRKFDFLMQEFLREANTLLSKSQDKALTRVGLDLKTVIDQMREQVQNVE